MDASSRTLQPGPRYTKLWRMPSTSSQMTFGMGRNRGQILSTMSAWWRTIGPGRFTPLAWSAGEQPGPLLLPRAPRLPQLRQQRFMRTLVPLADFEIGDVVFHRGDQIGDLFYGEIDLHRQPARSVRSLIFASAVVCQAMFAGESDPPHASGVL